MKSTEIDVKMCNDNFFFKAFVVNASTKKQKKGRVILLFFSFCHSTADQMNKAESPEGAVRVHIAPLPLDVSG